jgi:hypothetical protein
MKAQQTMGEGGPIQLGPESFVVYLHYGAILIQLE